MIKVIPGGGAGGGMCPHVARFISMAVVALSVALFRGTFGTFVTASSSFSTFCNTARAALKFLDLLVRQKLLLLQFNKTCPCFLSGFFSKKKFFTGGFALGKKRGDFNCQEKISSGWCSGCQVGPFSVFFSPCNREENCANLNLIF